MTMNWDGRNGETDANGAAGLSLFVGSNTAVGTYKIKVYLPESTAETFITVIVQ